MVDALEQHRKNSEEMELAGMIWWLILWHASDEGKLEIPSEQQWLSCELVAVLFEMLTGVELWFSWRHNIAGSECQHEWNEWPDELNEMLRMIKEGDGSVYGNMPILLKRFVRYEFNSQHDEKDFVSELKLFHEDHTPRPIGRSRFVPCSEIYTQAVGGLLRFTSAHHSDVCEWCRKIGMLMRKYIERDVAYIKAHYSW